MPSHTGNKHHNSIKILSHTFNKKYHLNKIRKKTVCTIFLPIIIGLVCNLPFDYAHAELGYFKESLKVEDLETFETEVKAITDSATHSIEASDSPAITDSALVLGMVVISETEKPPL